MEIHEDLQAYFKSIGLSQVAIAESLGVSKTYVNALLGGRQRFGKKQAQIWSEKFGLSKSWLLTGEGQMLKQEEKQESTAKPIGRPFRATIPEEGVVEVRYFHVTPTATFQDFCAGASEMPESYPIISRPGLNINEDHCVFEISGDSMSPQIPHGSKVLCREIKPSKWHQVSHGVIIIAYADSFVIKRIVKNRLDSDDYITITSDNPHYPGTVTIQRCQIRAIFQAQEVLSYPIH